MREATRLAMCMALLVWGCGGDVDDGRQSAAAGSGASHTGAGGTGGTGGEDLKPCQINGTGHLALRNDSSVVHYIVLDGASFAEMAPGDTVDVDLPAGTHSVEYHWGEDFRYQMECTTTVTVVVCGSDFLACASP